jgi:cupin superfamily acireductone dioxygenase involved in methionine salvage|tara:strand:- start:219 stop:443 length:225 start_codon:yes stop_codon:yes gene_type:complete
MSSMSEQLKERIHDLLKVNVEHKNLNADLRKEIKYLKDRCEFYLIQLDTLKSENRSLRNMGKDFINEHRNKGDM